MEIARDFNKTNGRTLREKAKIAFCLVLAFCRCEVKNPKEISKKKDSPSFLNFRL